MPYTAGSLTRDEYEQFHEEGFVIKHNLFPVKDLQPVMKGIEGLVDDLATRLHKAGKITDLCQEAGFLKRLTLIEKQYPNAAVLLHKNGILPKEMQQLWEDPRLISVATQILGSDVAGHPVWNLRCKTPQEDQATVPWHQDNSYLHPESWSKCQLTAWIPFLNANAQNGCMQVFRGGHKTGKTATHTGCWRGTWYLDLSMEEIEKELEVKQEDIVTCEVPLGSVLFLNNITPHRSLDNFSQDVRWSMDLRWQRPNEPNGLFGLKDSIPMRSSKDPEMKADWSSWANESRTDLQMDEGEDEFNSIISGPWMGTWELTNTNRHTAAYLADQQKD